MTELVFSQLYHCARLPLQWIGRVPGILPLQSPAGVNSGSLSKTRYFPKLAAGPRWRSEIGNAFDLALGQVVVWSEQEFVKTVVDWLATALPSRILRAFFVVEIVPPNLPIKRRMMAP